MIRNKWDRAERNDKERTEVTVEHKKDKRKKYELLGSVGKYVVLGKWKGGDIYHIIVKDDEGNIITEGDVHVTEEKDIIETLRVPTSIARKIVAWTGEVVYPCSSIYYRIIELRRGMAIRFKPCSITGLIYEVKEDERG
ncbi:hypothetical protein [Vulcanisaeta distributa]|uniref:hypothetical protein n=1 Tax=Vulcanisaeta distributa TaxID=164451 RepID=UPI0006CF976A|nr:hypothetical protein [Vulcanisaeta distributa]